VTIWLRLVQTNCLLYSEMHEATIYVANTISLCLIYLGNSMISTYKVMEGQAWCSSESYLTESLVHAIEAVSPHLRKRLASLYPFSTPHSCRSSGAGSVLSLIKLWLINVTTVHLYCTISAGRKRHFFPWPTWYLFSDYWQFWAQDGGWSSYWLKT
jgi:hypothetical protein